MTDKTYLELAQRLAIQSAEKVPCGCILVRDGEVIGRAFNSQQIDGIAVNHAEIKAVVAANVLFKSKTLKDATAYCTCEPCAMCLAAMSYAKIKRIVYAKRMVDLFPDDRQALFDSKKFIKTLNYVPILEQVLI